MSSADSFVQSESLPAPYVPPPPRTPSPRARKLVLGYQGAQQAMLMIGVVFAGMGSLFTAVFGWGLPADAALAVAGRPIEAVVVSAELNHSVEINEEHPTRITFAYEADGRRLQQSSDTLDEELIAAAQPGARVPVEFLPARPQWARLEGETYATFGWFGLFPLFFVAAGVAMTTAAVRSNRRDARAFIHGLPISGQVVFAGPDRSVKINGRHPFKVEWQFLVDGKLCSGSISSRRQEDLAEFDEGREIVVLYDPKDPRTNTIYID